MSRASSPKISARSTETNPEHVSADAPVEAPETVQASAWRWIRWAAMLLTLFIAYQLVLVVKSWAQAVVTIVLYVVFGGVLALILTPLVDALQRRARLPRAAGAAMAVVALLAILVGAVILSAGPVIAELKGMAHAAPAWIREAQNVVNSIAPQVDVPGLPSSGGLNSFLSGLTSRVPDVLLTGVTGAVTLVVDIVVVLVVTFWLLKDGAELRAAIQSWLPVRLRPEISFAFDAVQVVVGGYVRAQVLMAILIGALAGGGCWLLGVPFPLVVGIAAGIFELVPIVGPFVGGAVAVALALTISPALAAYTIVLFLGIHVLEGYILAPRIQAHFVQIHPMLAFLSLFGGAEIGGFVGAALAVPAVSLIAVFVRAALGDWKAHRPDLFAMARGNPVAERRRRHLLRQFRIFGRRARPT